MPDYRTRSGAPVTIEGMRSEDCPVSVLHDKPELVELVQIYQRSKIVGRDTVSRLPLRLADAFVILQGEDNRYDNAMNEAGMAEARRNTGK